MYHTKSTDMKTDETNLLRQYGFKYNQQMKSNQQQIPGSIYVIQGTKED